MTKRADLLILGAGAFAEEVADVATSSGQYQVIGFVEGLDCNRSNDKIAGKPIYWIDEIAPLLSKCFGICGIGSPRRSELIDRATSLGMRYTTVQHPTAIVSPLARWGIGCYFGPGCIVAAHVHIGDHVVLNRGCSIGHHTKVDSFVTVSPGVNFAGRGHVEHHAFLGIGATVIDGIRIGKHSLVGAGAVVTRDVPDTIKVVGVPARQVDR